MAGATGLVGRAVLNRLLADKAYTAVHTVGRRAPALVHTKLSVHISDSFEAALPPADDVFIALGTTIKAAGSQDAFRAIDFGAVVAVAKAARAAGCNRLAVVSAMGANTRSMAFYSRVKGEMEAAVSQMGFDTVVIARPSLLTGDRASLNQMTRLGEKLAQLATKWINPLLPADYRAIDADTVASALINAVKSSGPGLHILQSGVLQKG